MKKNKIEGVKPFNDFFFKSCYHQQLIAGIASFGIDRDAILLNSFVLIQNNFDVKKEDFINEKKIEKLLGYKRVHCNINKSKLFPRILRRRSSIRANLSCSTRSMPTI